MIATASESQHWYTPDGVPAYTFVNARGETRPTTLRDARRLHLIPSVTTILKMASNPGLEAWKMNQMLLAALTLPRNDEPEDVYLARIKEDSKQQARQAADRGSHIHGVLESYFATGVMQAEYAEYQANVDQALFKHFGRQEWLPEKSFGHALGFGGKVDLHSADVVVDFKTKEFGPDDSEKVAGYDDHVMQLAAYRVGLGIETARCANVFVSVSKPGLVVIREWTPEELDRGWEMFQCLLKFWYAKTQLKR